MSQLKCSEIVRLNILQNSTCYNDINSSGAQISKDSYINCKSYSYNSIIVGRYNEEGTNKTIVLIICTSHPRDFDIIITCDNAHILRCLPDGTQTDRF